MRTLLISAAGIVAAIATASCLADITTGAYLCGSEQLCPGGMACNGSDNVCVAAAAAVPFACDPMQQHEPDDTPAQAFAIATPGCVAQAATYDACLAQDDPANWIAFTAPTGCTAVQLGARAVFPIAWEPLAIQIWDLTTNAQVATSSACSDGAALVAGTTDQCVTVALVQGDRYGIEVAPAGGGDCNGACTYNRYALTLTFGTP